MRAALVSIIVPIYNAAPYLERTRESLLKQTHNNLEILLIDDGSQDSSLEICKDIARRDKRVQVLHHENQGASATRNRGIELSSGDYIMFMDADDALSPYAVESLLKAAETCKADISVGDVSVIYDNNCPDWSKPDIECCRQITSDEAYNHLSRYEWWGPYAKLYKASFLKQFRFPKETLSEDYYLMVQMFHQARLCHQPGAIYAYLKREDSLSTYSELSTRALDELYNTYNAWKYSKIYIPLFSDYALHFYTESCVKVACRAVQITSENNDYWSFALKGIKKQLLHIFFNGKTHFKLKILCLLLSLGKSSSRLVQHLQNHKP